MYHLLTLPFLHRELTGDSLAYAVFTGDSPPHSVWNQSHAINMAHLSKVISLYKKHFPTLPLYVAVGNHKRLAAI